MSVMVTVLPDGRIAVRNSRLGDNGPVLRFELHEWEAHIEAIKGNELAPWRLLLASAHSK